MAFRRVKPEKYPAQDEGRKAANTSFPNNVPMFVDTDGYTKPVASTTATLNSLKGVSSFALSATDPDLLNIYQNDRIIPVDTIRRGEKDDTWLVPCYGTLPNPIQSLVGKRVDFNISAGSTYVDSVFYSASPVTGQCVVEKIREVYNGIQYVEVSFSA